MNINNDKSAIERPTENELAWRNTKAYGTLVTIVLALVFVLGSSCNSDKSASTTKSVPISETKSGATPTTTGTPYAGFPSGVGEGERMVLDNAQVTAYVKLVDSGERRYKVRFIVKKPGSPLIAPIVRAFGSRQIHSVIVGGVDCDEDFCFSTPYVVDRDQNTHDVDAGRPYLSLVSRQMNGNEALGKAYYDLILKYERGK
jgi:hypothetical protein